MNDFMFVFGSIIFIIILSWIIVTIDNKQKGITAKRKQEKLEKKKTATFEHISGLPIAEEAICKVSLEDDRIKIVRNGDTYNLYKEKLLDVNIKTETVGSSQYVSSVGGAIAGGMIAGPLGAAIGGRTKEKGGMAHFYYLIFVYEKDGQLQSIVFNAMGQYSKACKFVEDFNRNKIGSNKEINL